MLRLLRTPIGRLSHPSIFRALSTSTTAALNANDAVARVYFEEEKPKISLHLPSRGLTSMMLPANRPLACLLEDIKDEDPEVKKAEFFDSEGYRTASSSLIGQVVKAGSKLTINGKPVEIVFPSLEERIKPKEEKLQELKLAIQPFETTKQHLDNKASRFINTLIWSGFVALCTQWGLMMRLTWYEYSWDVMEPIAYFLSFGTGIMGYAFYVVTKRDYTYEALEGHTLTRRQLRLYNRNKFDYQHYFMLRDSIEQVEKEIEDLKKTYLP